jgi:carboxylesterase type B
VGFLDQRFALEWVQSNIAAFGGDPAQVTVWGESSGAASVDRLLTTMVDNPPFRAAIMDSGQATTIASGAVDGDDSAWTGLVAALNCTNATSPLACVQAADAFQIRDILVEQQLSFVPVNDNVTQIATPLLAARAAGQVAHVPIFMGMNGQEGMFLAYGANITDFDSFTEDDLNVILQGLVKGNQAVATAIEKVIATLGVQYPWMGLFQRLALIATELLFQCVS